MATGPAGDEAAPGTKPGLSFLDLPAETQQEIVSHCSQSDLICVALVSKHFHELASAQLYRNFHIIFPDEDDLHFDSPIDGLAGGLDTFTTSDYNYAQHLKDLSMDTLSAGPKGEESYQSYLYSASCGKFLNTLLYLALRRAESLESFRWNIRVELSRPVYQVLHRIPSLKRLHIRMQAGASYYMLPPPLPNFPPPHVASPSNHWLELPPASPGSLPLPIPLPPPGTLPVALPGGPPPPVLYQPSSFKAAVKVKNPKRESQSRDPSTLAAFKNLKSLSVLDIDELDEFVTELKACIRNSSSTLNELQLSFSDTLAQQARKPPPESDPDDSDVDDEFQVVPASQNTSYDASGPAKAFRAQEERKVHEAVLGRILDVEPFLVKKDMLTPDSGDTDPTGEKGKDKDEEEDEAASSEDPRHEFISSIKVVSSKLMTLLNGSSDFSLSQQDVLDTIEKAARKYVDSSEATPAEGEAKDRPEKDKASSKDKGENPNAPIPATDVLDALLAGAETEAGPSVENSDTKEATTQGKNVSAEISTAQTVPEPATIKPSKGKGRETEASPEEIDMEHPDSAEDALDELIDQTAVAQEDKIQSDSVPTQSGVSESTASPKMTPASGAAGSTSVMDKTMSHLAAQRLNFETLVSRLGNLQTQCDRLTTKVQEMQTKNGGADPEKYRDAEAQLGSFIRSIADVQSQIKIVGAEISDAEKQMPDKSKTTGVERARRSMHDYVRDTRGFSLETLRLHLIPVKASVLSRGIDLGALKQLTLLNVGSQAPIWTLLSKENRGNPLALRSVFTDNVSNAFLTCMSQLQELHELFMLERSAKHKPESFAPKSVTTIDQIRRLVLAKHMFTLKRLMIKDESNNPNWDTNEKTMMLICTRGAKLEELAVSMNIHTVHVFVQFLSGLVNLRAINILHFKNNDTCIWVMREILKFIVDNLSHYPALKLEWIAMENDRVDRVVRPSDTPEVPATERKKKRKSKAKVAAPAAALGGDSTHDGFPVLPSIELDSESDSDDDFVDSGSRLRYKTVGPLQFYDVWGVKIFEKEIRSGKI